MSYTSIVGIGAPKRSHYKLTYFDSYGRAEATRILFELAGQPYEDIRVGNKEWEKLKPSTPFGQLPILEVDGYKVSQSTTIARFIAKRFGYYGKTDLEQIKIDMVADCAEDILKLSFPLFGETDEAKRKEIKKNIEEEKGPDMLQRLEKFIEPSGYFVGKDLTMADIAVYSCLFWMQLPSMGVDFSNCMKKCSKLSKLYTNIEKHPKIAVWMAKRPKTKF